MHHYEESGLPNVWLVNGFNVKQTPYGEALAIEDVEGLHTAIAKSLTRKPGRLTGAEFRFLRKHQDLSQKSLAELIGCDAQRINRWETHKTPVPKWADRIVRLIAREYADGNVQIRGFVDRLAEADAQDPDHLEFCRERSEWREAA